MTKNKWSAVVNHRDSHIFTIKTENI